jgi:hypothetical protein
VRCSETFRLRHYVGIAQLAEIALRSQQFDLLVISSLSDYDLHRIIGLSDGAEVLVLEEFTMPSELLSLVTQRLNRQQRA